MEDVLATRYASAEFIAIWSPEAKIKLERQFWVQVLKAQQKYGVEVTAAAIAAYENQIENVDLAAIAAREKALKHDVKARIDEFNALAGEEQIHKGMTSRDLTENIEQAQILSSLNLVRDRVIALLNNLAIKADQYAHLAIVGRSHNVAAQLTTLGKRFATAADALPAVAATRCAGCGLAPGCCQLPVVASARQQTAGSVRAQVGLQAFAAGFGFADTARSD